MRCCPPSGITKGVTSSERSEQRMTDVTVAARKAKVASRVLARAPAASRQKFLEALGETLQAQAAKIEAANQQDLAAAEKAGVDKPMLDRLSLRVADLVKNAHDVHALPDPLGEVSGVRVLESGLRTERRRVPLGVLLLIYESRPNATIEAAVLAVKSGNAIILKGGKEAELSNAALGDALSDALAKADLPRDAVQVLRGATHEDSLKLLALRDDIDLVIPRGGEKLITTVRDNARMPVLSHGPGVCHVYVDAEADLAQAQKIVLNAKLNRPSTCNAAETLLVHSKVAEKFLPAFVDQYIASGGELRACERSRAILKGAKTAGATVKAAEDTDFGREFLAPILACKIVDTMDEAISHIERFGTRHSEAICTTNIDNADRFARHVDASAVFVNASTRLNDGSALGLGAELGISTSKFHSYGSMGLAALTIEKTVAIGHGHVR